MKMPWKVSYVEGFSDFACKSKLSTIDLMRIKTRLDHVSQSPINLTEKVYDVGYPYVRRVKYVRAGNDYRIFVLLNPTTEEMYCLAIFSRESAYNKKVLNKVMTIIRNLKIADGEF